jgi:hypothetical protein
MRLRLFQDFSRLSAHLQSASVNLEDPLITFLPGLALSHRIPLVFDCVRNLPGDAHFENMHFYVPFSFNPTETRDGRGRSQVALEAQRSVGHRGRCHDWIEQRVEHSPSQKTHKP